MASSNIVSVALERSRPDEPWGLRLQGGVDCREPLSVFKVRRRSAAERAGIKVGDLVLAINDVTTGNLTHQQVLDLVSQQQLTLQVTLYRPVLDGAMVPSTGAADADASHQHPRDARSSSPALLAFIPFTVTQQPAALPRLPQLTSSWHGDVSPSISSSPYKLSYVAPPYRLSSQQQPKSYQPLDMTGKNAFYSTPTSYPYVPARRYYDGSSSWDRSDVGSAYSTQPSSTVSSPSDPADQTWKTSRSAYYSDDLGSSSVSLPPLQSHSFLLLEAALHAQGAGVPGLPPEAHHDT